MSKISLAVSEIGLFRVCIVKIRRVLQGVFFKYQYGSFGKKSVIYSPIRIFGKKRIYIGDGVTILHNARIEVTTDEPRKHPVLKIGEHTAIGQNLHLIVSNKVIIGNNVTLSANVFISDTNHSYTRINTHSLLQKKEIKETRIGDYSFIGYGAVIMPGVILGKQCIVGANSVVLPRKYLDYSVIAGVPARVIRRYNTISERWEKV